MPAVQHHCTSPLAQGSLTMSKTLVEKGAECNTANKQRRSPLAVACEMGYAYAVGVMLPKCSRNTITASFPSAARAGQVAIVQLLLDAGAAIDAVDHQNTLQTALHLGVSSGNKALIQELLVRKAFPDPKDFLRRTPLYIAARCNKVDCLKLLIKAGADVNVSDDFTATPLYAAATEGHEQCVDILFAARAAFTGTGYLRHRFLGRGTSLDIALCEFRADMFQKILERVRNRYGRVDVSNDALVSFLGVHPDKDPRGLNKDIVAKLRMLLDNGLQHDRIIAPSHAGRRSIGVVLAGHRLGDSGV